MTGNPRFIFLIVFFLNPLYNLFAQKWDLVKEKDGIKIYTRQEPNSNLKSFRGVVDLHAPLEKVYDLIGNVKNVDWWDKNLKNITILNYVKDKHTEYYLIYHVPWPLTDRDLAVEATITTNPVTGYRIVKSVPLKNFPEKPGLVRIKKYWQTWIVQPVGKDTVHIVLEGFVDPGGNIPSWLYNMVITDTPLKIIHGIQERLEKK